jgi:sphingomyelin phosphodiesterase
VVWSKYYSARETYGPTLGLLPSQALTAPVMHNITAALEADGDAFAAFHERLGRGLGSAEPCVDACKARTICQLRAMRSEDNCVRTAFLFLFLPPRELTFYAQWEPTPGLQFKRDGASEHGHEEEHCEGSKVRSIFRAMVGREVTPSDLMDLGA